MNYGILYCITLYIIYLLTYSQSDVKYFFLPLFETEQLEAVAGFFMRFIFMNQFFLETNEELNGSELFLEKSCFSQ